MFMKIKILIADDESLARNELIYLLERIGNIEIVGEASTGKDTLLKAKETHPDTVFLDIEMPQMNGIEVAREMLYWYDPPSIVFATAFDEYAIKAFELNAVDYVLKPFEEERILLTLERIRSKTEPRNHYTQNITRFLEQFQFSNVAQKLSKIAVHEGETLILLDPNEILYISREGRGIFVHTNDHQYESKYSLQLLESKLYNYSFFRTHRAYLVNLNHVDQLIPWFNGAYNLILRDPKRTTIPVSRSYIKSLKDILGII